MTTPFEATSLVCDGERCEAEVVGSAVVRAPHDDHAVERARREARRNAIDMAAADGWQVGRAGDPKDLCPACSAHASTREG